MSYFQICTKCGAHLDPGEKCDCENTIRQSGGNDSGQIIRSSSKKTYGSNGERGHAFGSHNVHAG